MSSATVCNPVWVNAFSHTRTSIPCEVDLNSTTQLCNTHANARGSMASDLVEVDATRSWAPAIEDDPTAWTMGRGSTHAYAQCIVDTADMVRHGDGDPRMDFECASVLGAFRRSQIVRDTTCSYISIERSSTPVVPYRYTVFILSIL